VPPVTICLITQR